MSAKGWILEANFELSVTGITTSPVFGLATRPLSPSDLVFSNNFFNLVFERLMKLGVFHYKANIWVLSCSEKRKHHQRRMTPT